MRAYHQLGPAIVRFVIVLVSVVLASSPARAVLQTFSGPWDPTNPTAGFSLRATDHGGAATMQVSPDGLTLTVQLTLTNCHQGCGAFYLDHAAGALPHGQVTFDWIVETNDRTVDGQIAINGADVTVNDGARDLLLYPSQFTGSADINYQGGLFTFFNIGIGAADTGSTTATVQLSYLSAPEAAIVSGRQTGGATTVVPEPAGWGALLVGLMAIYCFRRPRAGAG